MLDGVNKPLFLKERDLSLVSEALSPEEVLELVVISVGHDILEAIGLSPDLKLIHYLVSETLQ